LRLSNLPKGVRECKENSEAIHEIWDKIKGYGKLFVESKIWDEYVFAKGILQPHCYALEIDGGVVLIRDIRRNLSGNVVVSFWDSKLGNKVEILKEIFLYFFLLFDLARLEVFIPDFCRALRRFFEEKLKFTYEGRMRKKMWYKDHLVDVIILSLLREEI